MNHHKLSDGKIEKLTKQIDKKQRQIEEMRMKRKHHELDDAKFPMKKRRIESQIQNIKIKIEGITYEKKDP